MMMYLIDTETEWKDLVESLDVEHLSGMQGWTEPKSYPVFVVYNPDSDGGNYDMFFMDYQYAEEYSEMMQDKKEKEISPLNHDMPIGTLVILTEDDGSETETMTRSEPWQLGDGTWVVQVDGKTGGYNLARVEPDRSQTICGTKYPMGPMITIDQDPTQPVISDGAYQHMIADFLPDQAKQMMAAILQVFHSGKLYYDDQAHAWCAGFSAGYCEHRDTHRSKAEDEEARRSMDLVTGLDDPFPNEDAVIIPNGLESLDPVGTDPIGLHTAVRLDEILNDESEDEDDAN